MAKFVATESHRRILPKNWTQWFSRYWI